MANKDESFAIPGYIHSDSAGTEIVVKFLKEYEMSLRWAPILLRGHISARVLTNVLALGANTFTWAY